MRLRPLLILAAALSMWASAAAAGAPSPAASRLAVRRSPLVVAGAPVLGGGRFELRGHSGDVLWQHERPAASLNLTAADWQLGAAGAVSLALAHEAMPRPRTATRVDHRFARRAVLPVGGGVPLWVVHLPPIVALAYNPVFLIDARSGRVLHSENRVFTESRVRIFDGNPVSTPEAHDVPLFGLTSEEPGAFLSGPLVNAYNCPDRGELFDVVLMGMRAQVHLCSEVHVAAADESGDFLYSENDPNDPEDLFAEAHMFYHVSNVYRFFQSLGFEELRQVPLRAVVNFRMPDLLNALSPDSELVAFDNAFFMSAHDIRDIIDRPEDSIVFGQGTLVDFAYDADVIYHEFTHAVVDTLTGMEMTTLDRWGVSMAPGSLHEGYADYFAAALSGDGAVGEYAGSGFDPEGGAIRDIEDRRTCPDDLIGEVHYDSQPLSGALWTLRKQLIEGGADPATIDLSVLDGLRALPPDAGYEAAASATLAAFEAHLGDTAAVTAEAVFADYGILDCRRVIETQAKDLLYLPGMSAWMLANYVPGFLQFRVPTEPEHGLLHVEFLLPEAGMAVIPGFGGGTPDPWVMIRAGAEPIEIAYSTDTGELRAEPTADRFAAVEDLDADLPTWPHRARATVRFAPGQAFVHAMIFNRGEGEAYLQEIRLTTEPDPEHPYVPEPTPDGGVADDGGQPDPVDAGVDEPDLDPDPEQPGPDLGVDSGADPVDSGPAPPEGDAEEDAGCGCRAAGSGPAGGAVVSLVLLALFVLRASSRRGRARP